MDILILLGSDSDADVGAKIIEVFNEMGISYEINVASAHRSPERVRSLIKKAESDGMKVVIACAGLSAHLAGVVASETLAPVIGIPMAGGSLGGMDSLLSTVNMPGGVPVATVSIGKAGGKNAALLAARILALSDDSLAAALIKYKENMATAVEEADARLKNKL